MNASGAFTGGAQISSVTDVSAIKIVGLTGGGSAITWHDLTTDAVNYSVFSNTNALILLPTQTGAAGGQNEPSIAALADGGFVIVWDDETAGDIRGQRFSANGTALGAAFVVNTAGAQSAPSVTGLDDGRFQITWVEDGDIRSEIFDARDVVNNPDVYTPDGWHVGTVDGDVFTTSGNAEIAHGWDGADLITEGAGTVQIFGDGGNDTIIVTSAISANLWDGGAGLGDTINWSAVNETGATFDLKLGIATSASLNFEQMLNFENLIGTANRDIIIGNGNINFIDGGAGNDDIDGGGGADALVGGAGDDLIHGDGLGDTLLMDDYTNPAATNGNDTGYGDAGTDLLWGYGGNDTLYGGTRTIRWSATTMAALLRV